MYVSFVGGEVKCIWKIKARYLGRYKQAILTIFATVLPKFPNFKEHEGERREMSGSVRNLAKFWSSRFLATSRVERFAYGRGQQQARNQRSQNPIKKTQTV